MSEPFKRIFIAIPSTVGHTRDMIRGVFAGQPPGLDWELHVGSLGKGLNPERWAGCIHLGGSAPEISVPCVECSNGFEPEGLDSIHEDNVQAGRMAANYFLDQGYDSFLHVSIPSPLYAQERRQGFEEILGDKMQLFPIWGENFHDATDNRSLLELIHSLPKPLAVFAASDAAGLHVLRMLRRSDLLLPEEVAVMGVDNDDLTCRLPRPTLSSIRLPGERIGRMAAQMLQERLADPSLPPRRIRLAPLGIQERESCSRLALRHPDVRKAMACIRLHASEGIGVPDIVAKTQLKRRALEQHFQKETGQSLHSALQAQRLEQAKRMLRDPECSLKEIANRCGFQSASRFSVVFRQAEGVSPREFRTQQS